MIDRADRRETVHMATDRADRRETVHRVTDRADHRETVHTGTEIIVHRMEEETIGLEASLNLIRIKMTIIMEDVRKEIISEKTTETI